MLSQFLTEDNNNTTEIRTKFLKIIAKTLIVRNVVYQIHNIASIGLVDLTTTKAIPKYFWVLLVIGIGSLLSGNLQIVIFGIVILVVVAWLFYHHNKTKTRERYGLTIYTNAGTKNIIPSSSKEFIKKIIFTLYKVMNTEEAKAITFNLENCSIDQSDKSIENGTNLGYTIISGDVEGDIFNEF